MASLAAYRDPDRLSATAQSLNAPAKEFDLVTLPLRQRVSTRPCQIADIPLLLRYAETAMGVPLAPEATVTRIACGHPDSVWSFWRHGRLVGGAALLMLNGRGLAALLDDSIDLGDPPPAIFADAGHRPAAIYVWAILGATSAAEGIANVIVRMQQRPYATADLFAIPATDDGLRFTRGLGFRLVPEHPRPLYRYVRLTNRTQSSGDEFDECFCA
jgi:hypothetical protein